MFFNKCIFLYDKINYRVRGKRMNYLDLINNTINYIEDNLNKELKVEDIASRYYFSKFHFYRIFRALTGYTISDYIDLRRLDQVKQLLRSSNSNVLDIALDCGFNSHEVLSRKFKRKFNITPLQYRRGNIDLKDFTKIKLIERDFINKKSDIIVNFETKFYERRTIIGKRCNNSDDLVDEHTIGNFLFEFAHECFDNYPEGSLYLAIMFLDKGTNTIEYFVGFDELFYDSSYASQSIERSNYAIFSYKGIFKDNITAITNDIYRTIAISELEINNVGVEFIEVYNREYLETGIFEIQVPINNKNDITAISVKKI